MNKGKKITITAFLTAVLLVALLSTLHPIGNGDTGEALILYCAAGSKPAILPLAQAYEKKYGQEIQLMYGGSGTLLSNIQVARQGDLYIAADQSYLELAADKNLVAEIFPLATQRPVIVVTKGNPKNIRSIDDLKRADIRLALGNPESASIGKQTKNLLEKTGDWPAIKKRVEQSGVFKPAVPEVANDVKLGAVDAGIIWDSTAAQYPELDTVSLPVFEEARMLVSVAVLRTSQQPEAALRFAHFLNSAEGYALFMHYGFSPVDGTGQTIQP